MGGFFITVIVTSVYWRARYGGFSNIVCWRKSKSTQFQKTKIIDADLGFASVLFDVEILTKFQIRF